MQFSNRAQGFRNDKSQEISSTTAKSYQPVTQGVVGDKSSSINNIRDPEKKEDIVEEFPSWAGKPKISLNPNTYPNLVNKLYILCLKSGNINNIGNFEFFSDPH